MKCLSSFALVALCSLLPACAVPPLDVGDRLVLSADHPFVIPPEGIRFTNGATLGVPSSSSASLF